MQLEDREMDLAGEDEGDFAQPGFGLDEPDSEDEAQAIGERGEFDDQQVRRFNVTMSKEVSCWT
jgi:hypothetical protein